MQLTRAEFEERGVAERLKLPEMIASISKTVTYTILISNETICIHFSKKYCFKSLDNLSTNPPNLRAIEPSVPLL